MEFRNQKLEDFEKKLKNQKVAVIGLGVSNIPLIDYLYNKKSNRDNAKTINKWLKEMKNTKSLLTSNKYLFNDVKKNRLNIEKDNIQ